MSAVVGEPSAAPADSSGAPAPGRWPSGVLAQVGRIWRSFAQVMLFGMFAVNGVVMTALIAPALTVAVRDRRRRAMLARACVQRLLAFHTGAMLALRLIQLEIIGAERLALSGALMVANHPTLIDAFFLLGRVRGLVPIAKRALLDNPFTRGAIVTADYQLNDAGPALLDACRARVARGETLLLFPEGSRTSADGAVRLRRGAAQLAVRCGCAVVPVTIAVSDRFLVRGMPWWLAAPRLPRFRIEVHAPVDPAPFVTASSNAALAARRLTEHLQKFYS